jgi:chromosome partitioning protein
MKVISISIQKGGSAKTTTVQAMAEILARDYGKKVLCIDTDPQASLTQAAGIDPAEIENNLYDALKGDKDVNDAIYSVGYYDIIPSSILLSSASQTFTQPGKEYLLKEKISEIKSKYDYCLIDTPPALSIMTIMAWTASSAGTIIPLEPSKFALMGMEQLEDNIKLVKKYYNEKLKIIGILVIKYKGQTNLNRVILENIPTVAKKMETKIFKTQIRESVRIGELQLMGKAITDEKSNASDDYKAFIKELEG